MKLCLRLLPLLALAATTMAQVSIVSTSPTNNQTNVALSTTITITFNTALDTNAIKMQEDFAFTNIQSPEEPYYSSDATQFKANVQLQSNTAYFIAFMYAKALNGSTMASPYVFYFTTGSSFPSTTVSGTVSSGTTGVSPENGVIGLNTFDITSDGGDGDGGDDGPDFAMMTKLNSDGTFTIPYVSNGTYWPIAAKDVNGDGKIDPESGTDVIALGDSIVVSGSNVTGVALTFIKITPFLFSEALTEANGLAASLPSGSVLKYVQSYDMDTLGRGRQWEFDYHSPSTSQFFGIRISGFEQRVDSLNPDWYSWLSSLTNLTNPQNAASSSTVIANVEAAGGKAFRTQTGMGQSQFQIQATLGDQSNSRFWYLSPDPAKQYWGIAYTWYQQNDTNWITIEEKGFLCDFSTGAVVVSGTPTGVDEQPVVVPVSPSLEQNYPNPFNPTTTIEFSLQERALVKLTVYNVLGEVVAVLVDGAQSAGTHRLVFDAKGLPSGMYMYRLTTGSAVKSGKMLLVR
ncbi:MAG: T9SS type A sorting domain-containing protein [Ignavibacteriales bacterium]|nr:T9SS type A sorting domain-containing protein [Ignavibacteriales bacterium]